MATTAELYDSVSYPGTANPDTHPGRLAAMAMLHGLDPALPDACRVLEIGCNAGTNLIPMAYALPGSDFTGFDLAGAAIAAGLKRITLLGLENVRLLQADIMKAEQLPELAGQFDYIIAHGVYTWVPEPVREGLLAYIREHLAENGVAFVSYATLPGCHVRLMTREIMAGRRAEPDQTADDMQDSIHFLEFIAGSRPQGDSLRILLERELRTMERRGPAGVFHDEAAPFYRPVYFREFVEHAGRHGLSFFSDSEFPAAGDVTYQQTTVAAVRELAPDDPIAQEQMLDFARMRVYRESLLCRRETEFIYSLQADALRGLFFMSQAATGDSETPGRRVYSLPGKATIETESPATIVLLDLLISAVPEPVGFAAVLAAVRDRLPVEEPDLLGLLMRLVLTRFVDAYAWKPPVRRQLADRPEASRASREEALREDRVITLLHTVLDVADPMVKKLLLLLDGERDRADLHRELARAFPDRPNEGLEDEIGAVLRIFNQASVLEARS